MTIETIFCAVLAATDIALIGHVLFALMKP